MRWDLHFSESASNFGYRFCRTIPSATRRVLNVQRNELEQHGLIGKSVFPELPPRVEYHLTGLGQSLLPVLEAMEQWGNAHRPELEQVLAVSLAELPG